MHTLLDLTGQRIGGSEVALPALVGLTETAVPTAFFVVFLTVDRNGDAVRQGRNVQKLRLWTIRRRPIVIAASLGRTHPLERLARNKVADPRIGLDVFGGIVVERLASLLVDALGPVHLHVGLR